MTTDAKINELLERVSRLELQFESLLKASLDLEREHKLLKHAFEQDHSRRLWMNALFGPRHKPGDWEVKSG